MEVELHLKNYWYFLAESFWKYLGLFETEFLTFMAEMAL